MNALHMANAIVHFRMLRSLGWFYPTHQPGVYRFHPGVLGPLPKEELPNGIPDPVSTLKVKSIIDHYSVELAMLCQQHYS